MKDCLRRPERAIGEWILWKNGRAQMGLTRKLHEIVPTVVAPGNPSTVVGSYNLLLV
jgi:hypothetical protein